MSEEKVVKVRAIKPAVLKMRTQAKDGKWKTDNAETVSYKKAFVKVKSGELTLRLPNDWNEELTGEAKPAASYMLMRIPNKPKVRTAAKKVAKKATKKKAVAKKAKKK